ncbi:uncharacterized protein PG986_012249 [Apiospora aurea]|uniref:Secreted protein n=1 Tax=Apiospora aurea TaxID=335848 RepID=A0ABR1PZG4_9PEZI
MWSQWQATATATSRRAPARAAAAIVSSWPAKQPCHAPDPKRGVRAFSSVHCICFDFVFVFGKAVGGMVTSHLAPKGNDNAWPAPNFFLWLHRTFATPPEGRPPETPKISSSPSIRRPTSAVDTHRMTTSTMTHTCESLGRTRKSPSSTVFTTSQTHGARGKSDLWAR